MQKTSGRRSIPKIARFFLFRFLPFCEREALIGDFDEIFLDVERRRGTLPARLWCWGQVGLLLPRSAGDSISWGGLMFRNTIKIMLRNLMRQKITAAINIAGLGIGIACCILIMLWVQDELSYDRFHENADELHIATFSNGSTSTPTALSGYLKAEYPEILFSSRLQRIGRNLIKHEAKEFNVGDGIMVDPDFLTMFTLPLLRGDPKTALDDPEAIMISEELARKYFGGEDPLGQTMTFNVRNQLKVTGVFEDYPANSHIRLAYILPLRGAKAWRAELNTWQVNNIRTYVRIRPGTPIEHLDSKIEKVVEIHRPQDQRALSLQPITRLHLDPFNDTGGTLGYVYLFSAMAVFILLIACINFINLTTARSASRAREVGIRKTVGACQASLIRQFYGESVFMTAVSSSLGIGLAILCLPLFNNLTGKSFTWEFMSRQTVLPGIFGIILLTVIAAGSYPALFLSRFQPVGVMKSKLGSGGKTHVFRRGLVIVQFALSILLVLGTLIIYRQVHYLQERDVGFNRDNIVFFGIGSRFRRGRDTIKTKLLAHPDIHGLTLTDVAPYRWNSNAGIGDVHWEGKTTQQVKMVMTSVDYDYLETFGLKLAEGRFFSREYATDPDDAYVVNQAAVRAMEMESPIGKRLRVWDKSGTIIGVLEDYHFESLHNTIIPMAMRIDPGWHGQACVRISPLRVSGTLAFLEENWKEIYPEYPFEYSFLDDTIRSQYRAEESVGKIVTVFTVLALFISCLGIFGLSSYTAEQRTKEIGIRKVLGASVMSIIRSISREFVVLVIVANLLVWAPAYYLLHRWLRTFAYRIDIGWWSFPLTGAAVLVLALLTVIREIRRAAAADPVKALRYE